MAMPVSTISARPKSRRALLAGALGGIGAWVASAIGRAAPTRAGVDGDVVLGASNVTPGGQTQITNNVNPNTAFVGQNTGSGRGLMGISNTFRGVEGLSTSDIGVVGFSASGIGVAGDSPFNIAVRGFGGALDQPAILGWNDGGSTAIHGHCGPASPPPPTANTGVYGFSAQSTTSAGVWGHSPNGHGIHGESATGWAGYFDGRVFAKREIMLQEIATPSAPGSNRAKLFVRDNGSGKTQLCVRFHTGAVRVLATQP